MRNFVVVGIAILLVSSFGVMAFLNSAPGEEFIDGFFYGWTKNNAQTKTIEPTLDGIVSERLTAQYRRQYAEALDMEKLLQERDPGTFPEPQRFGTSPVLGQLIDGLPAMCADELISVSGCGGQRTLTTAQGNTYDLIEVGNQCWFADNVREVPDGSPDDYGFYDDAERFLPNSWYGFYDQAKDEAFPGAGMLYSWDAALNGKATKREFTKCWPPGEQTPGSVCRDDIEVGATEGERAQGICPAGWHIPSDCEWLALEHHHGMEAEHITNWGLRTMPRALQRGLFPGYAGYYEGTYGGELDEFERKEDVAHYWTSTIGEIGEPVYRRFFSELPHFVARLDDTSWNKGHSIKCIKD